MKLSGGNIKLLAEQQDFMYVVLESPDDIVYRIESAVFESGVRFTFFNGVRYDEDGMRFDKSIHPTEIRSWLNEFEFNSLTKDWKLQ